MSAHFYHEEEVMGTVITFDAYFATPEVPSSVYSQLSFACEELHRIDALFSTYKSDSELSRYRRGELPLDAAHPDLAEVYDLSLHARRLTDGIFDPWALPGGFDPTGLVKGWAASRALTLFISPEMSGALVNAAGDIALGGNLANGELFRLGVVDPTNQSTLLQILPTRLSLATSGTQVHGQHLFDPSTSTYRARALSASVLGPDLALADALATALCVAGRARVDLVENLDGYEALIVDSAGLVTTSTWPGTPFAKSPAAP